MAVSDEPSGAVAEAAAADLIDVCKADGDACALALRLAVAWHQISREFQEDHPRFCLTESDIENGHARDMLIAITLPQDGAVGMKSIDLVCRQPFPATALSRTSQ